jgi:hypothetical protein
MKDLGHSSVRASRTPRWLYAILLWHERKTATREQLATLPTQPGSLPSEKIRSQKGTPYCKRKPKPAQSPGSGRQLQVAAQLSRGWRRPGFVWSARTQYCVTRKPGVSSPILYRWGRRFRLVEQGG